ncbi:MAG: hypothetical protein HYR49_01780 [Gammaproteobacteria bacterium]|nr:hypothetical protein [Gammaproteobacteria bacterium]
MTPAIVLRPGDVSHADGHSLRNIEDIQRVAAPMVDGMVTAPLLSMIVIPAANLMIRGLRFAPAKE